MDKNWKDIVIEPTLELREALKVIDQGALRLALVVDDSGKLLGTLSDGDVRRALINGLPLTGAVADAMNTHPRTVPASTESDEALAIMERNDLLVVPIVDAQGNLHGLFSHKEFLLPKRRDNWVFLMAGGYGKRLRPYTDQCPKPMLEVGGKPLLQRILESCKAAGFHKFYISVHYMADTIKDFFGDGSAWDVTVEYVEESTPLGTGGALGLLPTTDQLPLLMMNGDVLTKVDLEQLMQFHEEHNADLTMCVREYDFTVPYGVVETSGRKVTAITEKPVHKFFVNAGIYVLSANTVSNVVRDKRLDMTDLAQALINDGNDVSVFPLHEYWLDIGKPDDFLRAQEEINTHFDQNSNHFAG